MENATQALLMAAGVLIALVVISLGIMFFSSASSLGESYETQMSAVEIQQFNNQFDNFSKTPKYVKSDYDENGKLDSDYKSYTEFDPDNSDSSEYIFQDYNAISDVVSAVNLAYNINAVNNYEQDVGIQIVIKGLNEIDNSFQSRVGINPSIQKNNKNNNISDEHKIYMLDSDLKKVYSEDKYISIDKLINLNDVLKKANTCKLNNNNERVYKYGFSGTTELNPKTGLIHIVIFELFENKNYVE